MISRNRGWTPRAGRATFHRSRGALDPGCVRVRARGDGARVRRRARRRRRSTRADEGVGRRLLGAPFVHDADGARDHHRIRARVGGPGAPAHRVARRPREVTARSGSPRRGLRDALVVAELGILARIFRRARPRDRAPDAWRRLPRARCSEPPRARQRVGAGALRISRLADGDALGALREDPHDRRRGRPRSG